MRILGGTGDAEIIVSQPGLGPILGARVLAEFGDDPRRYADAKSRKNYAATSPITRASGKKKVVMARFVHNDRFIDTLMTQAFAALNASPGARGYYDQLKTNGIEKSPNTVKTYAHDLKDWFTYLAGHGLDWRRATLEDVTGFVAWLRLPPEARAGKVAVLASVEHYCSASSVNRKLAALT